MKQAIEEGFILDVLKNYTTYTSYWKLIKAIDDDPKYQTSKAKNLLRRFVDEHPESIARRVQIIAEHFHEQVSHEIGGNAKAMIVTKSRPQAVRYFLALRKYLEDNNYPYQVMVAFSGTVRDGGHAYTESNLNGFPESQTTEIFERHENRFMVVANKFQTGFDQPLLHTMYVDKHLSGVHAVQTLSRLNRTLEPHKQSTMILDFTNEAEHIQKSFEPYYEQTILSESTDNNLLYDRETELKAFDLFTSDEVERFAELYYTPGTTQDKLHAPLQPAVDRYVLLEEDVQADFRAKLIDYIRQYSFLSQILPFEDPDLEKLYTYTRFLLRKLPIRRTEMPYEVLGDVELEAYRVQQTSTGSIALKADGVLDPINLPVGAGSPDDPDEVLSQILDQLNSIFGHNLTETDKLQLIYLRDNLTNSEAVRKSLISQPNDKVRMTVNKVADELVQETFQSNFDFYKKVMDNERFRNVLFTWLFEQVIKDKAS